MKQLRRLILPSAVLACLITMNAGDVAAQHGTDDHSVHTLPVCGSDWARHLSYSIVPVETVAEEHTSTGNVPAIKLEGGRVARSEKFFVPSQSEKTWGTVNATPVYEGKVVMIWLANQYYDSLSREVVSRLAVGLEDRVKEGPATRNPNKGVIANDIEMFGEPFVDRWSKGTVKVHILLMKINSPVGGGVVDGYFNPHDQTDRFGSNKRNLLYIDVRRLLQGKQEGIDHVLGTIAHEFQHLINYSRYRGVYDDTHWMYNEGLSEVASIRNGYWSRNADNYLNSPNRFEYFNAPVGSGDGDSVLRAYERAMLWIYYLSERFGDGFLSELVVATGTGIEPVRMAMRESGQGADAEGVMGRFWAANYLQGIDGFHGDPRYSYGFPISSISSGTVIQGDLPLIPQTESVNILEFAAYYPHYINNDPKGAGLKVRFFSGPNLYRVHAIVFRPDNSVDVKVVDPDKETLFEGFTDIVFSVANVSSNVQTVWWSAERVLPGVDDGFGKSSFTFVDEKPE